MKSTLLPIDIHYIKENLTDRIQVKNIAGFSMQEICVDITDLVKSKAEFNLLDNHKIYFTFNQLSRLSDPEIKERTLSKSYPNAMRILTDEVFHILYNYVTVPGSIYEIHMIELEDNTYITRHEFESDINGRSYEYNIIVNLFNDIIDNIPANEKFMIYTNTEFKSIGVMNCMTLTSYNKQEVSKWIYDAINNGSYIIDLRKNVYNSKSIRYLEFTVIFFENTQYTIYETDVIVKADNKLFIIHKDLFKELFIQSPYGKYEWDYNHGSVIRRNTNITSYFHYDIHGMIKYLDVSTDINNPFPTESGNWQGLNITIPKECEDYINFPKIYVDDNDTPIYEGIYSIPVNNAIINLKIKYSNDKLVYKYIFKWSEKHSDTIILDATNAILLTQEETTALHNN